MKPRIGTAAWVRLPLDYADPDDVAPEVEIEPPPRGTRRGRLRRDSGELAGSVRIRHDGREYCGWYRVAGDLLTVYCGLASNTGLLPTVLPSPTPLAERLLRELIEAEHPGLNSA